ncbi:uncharacterized protein LAESUDRAFT_329308 [Laetiporus sulphureus 93-53]|uniref:Uncharacterized protein n=1 Tax=Laetiporus sulphureus 93-53 TaxID=1314785 RepID=A0A165CX33_9APHY|nr:uncharacterized protein LAESUDRAFT_329308 [Laetiporus sulphureus 93-53]KZT03630.1 hypothetical protein LAESUDRAFT_329308 [Laetiporus sulphureus 93-53]
MSVRGSRLTPSAGDDGRPQVASLQLSCEPTTKRNWFEDSAWCCSQREQGHQKGRRYGISSTCKGHAASPLLLAFAVREMYARHCVLWRFSHLRRIPLNFSGRSARPRRPKSPWHSHQRNFDPIVASSFPSRRLCFYGVS